MQSCCHASTHVTLDLNAEMAGLAPVGDTLPSKHVMLRVNDEIAGLIEAADMPADQAGAHSTKSEPAALLPGKVQFCLSRLQLRLVRVQLGYERSSGIL